MMGGSMTVWVLRLLCYSVLYYSLLGIVAQRSPLIVGRVEARFYRVARWGQALVFAAVTVCVDSVVMLFPGGSTLLLSSAMASVLMMWVLANGMVYIRYGFFAQLPVLKLAFCRGGTEVVQIAWHEYVMVAVAALLMFALMYVVHMASLYIQLPPGAYYLLLGSVAILIINYITAQCWYIHLSRRGSESCLRGLPKLYGFEWLAWWRPLSALLGWSVPETAYRGQLQRALRAPHFHYPRRPLATSAVTKRYNVLMVVVDAWRFDCCNAVVTPRVATFAKQGRCFQHHMSGGNTTQPGIFSLLYGVTPNYWSVATRLRRSPLLFDTLLAQGYDIDVLASATPTNPPFHHNAFSGITNLRHFTPGKTLSDRDQRITDDMVELLDRDTGRPWFRFMFYDAPHGYFALPDVPQRFKPTARVNHITLDHNVPIDPIFNTYKNAVYATDQRIGTVLDALEASGQKNDTMVIITADHGQEFNDLGKGYWEHPTNFGRFQTQVPLVIWHPEWGAGEVNHSTTHYDIAPTLMQEVLGVTNAASDYGIGDHLLTAARPRAWVVANYTHYAMVDEQHIVPFYPNGAYQVYDHDMNELPFTRPNAASMARVMAQMQAFSTTNEN